MSNARLDEIKGRFEANDVDAYNRICDHACEDIGFLLAEVERMRPVIDAALAMQESFDNNDSDLSDFKAGLEICRKARETP